MKIVQVMPEFGLAGAEIMCENLTYELKKCGHEVFVVSMYNFHSAITDRLESKGIPIYYLDKKLGLDFSMIFKMKNLFKKLNVEVVHTHRNCAQYAVPAAMMLGIKILVHTVHSVAKKENGKAARVLNKVFFKFFHLVPVALSKLVQNTVVQEYKVKQEKIPIVFNGIDLSRCIPKKNYRSEGPFKILHIGRFSEEKNHIGLVKAFGLFHSKYPESELWLIGDGDLRPQIEQSVKVNGLESSVIFLGLKDNVYDYLNRADVFALPSHYEGIPMTLIEAMGTGLPIVVTAVGGISEMLDNESAIFTEIGEKQIAAAFERLYCSSDLRASLGRNALSSSVSFSADAMAKKYEEIYCKQREDARK